MSTAGALSVAVYAALRERAASGPFVTELDGGPALIEWDGKVLNEYPLPGDGTVTAA